MIHRLAQMRGDPPIPQLDVTRPALAPKDSVTVLAADTERLERQRGRTPESLTPLQPCAARDACVVADPGTGGDPGSSTRSESPAAAPAFVVGERVMYCFSSESTYFPAVCEGQHSDPAQWVIRTQSGAYGGHWKRCIRRPTPDELARYWPEDAS